MPIDIENDDLPTALKKLKAREDTLRQLESVSRIGSWETDLQTGVSLWSEQNYEIYGLPTNRQITIEYFFSVLLPEYRLEAKAMLEDVIKSGKVQTYICKVKHSSGKNLDLLLHAQAIYSEENTPLKLIGTTQDITEQTATKEHTLELSKLLEYSSNEIYIIDKNNLNYLYVNKGACNALGFSQEELLSKNIYDINPNINRETILELQLQLETKNHVLNKTLHQCKDGTRYHVQSYIHRFKYKGEDVYVIFDTNITSTVELELQYEKQANVLEYIHDSVIATDIDGTITSWNRGSVSLFKYKKNEIISKNILNIYNIKNKFSPSELFNKLKENENLTIEAYMLSKEKKNILCDISLSISRDRDGKLDGYIGYIQDITQQKEIEEKLKRQQQLLHYQANHDALTDLPNRTLFKDRLAHAIRSSKRHKTMFALLFLDLDQFKKINDSLGHHIGDKVLIETAVRIKSILREEDTLSRLGGDEFTVIINIQKKEDASLVAQKIINIMKEPLQVNTQNLYLTSSIGISIYPNDSQNEENLIKYADVAMYKAKDEGRNNYQFYSSDMTAYAFERVVMESNLRIAIKEEQFVVYYQPQIEIKTEKIIGMEALVRWVHPKLGLIPPGDFIPLAEESGLIIEIDRLVMKLAIKQVALWHQEQLNPGSLSLNLAMKQLNEEDFLFQLTKTMKEANFQAKWLELEVTEGEIMQNPLVAIKRLKTLSELGIEIAIDDFGTGYSSLSYLKKLPLDKLKIDQSFVKDIPTSEDDIAITKAIIALGKSLNLKIIAEGVEEIEQRDFLRKHHCDMIQGYLYSKPIPADKMRLLLHSNGIWHH